MSRDDHRLAAVGGGAAGAHRAGRSRCRRSPRCSRRGRLGAAPCAGARRPRRAAARRPARRWKLALDQPDQGVEHAGQRLAARDQLEHVALPAQQRVEPLRLVVPQRSGARRGALRGHGASLIGTCNPLAMDLTFSDKETAFRDELRDVARRQPPRRRAASAGEDAHYALAPRLAAQALRRRLGRACLAAGVRRPRRLADRVRDLLRGARPRRRAAAGQRARPAARRPDADGLGHRRAEGALPAADPLAPRRSGARASPSPTRARTSPR